MKKPFNLTKYAKNDYTSYNKMLEEKNKEMGFESPDVTTEVNLDTNKDKSNRKNNDNTITYENQLEASRKGADEKITEGSLDSTKKMYNEKRLDTWNTPINSVTNVVSEAFDQKHLEAFKEAETEKRDTSFWDKYVGLQMDNEKTTIPSNTQKSQLQNIPSRFNGLEKTQPISGDLKENESMLSKGDKYYEMVMAQLKDADALLFHIYASAESQNRKLTSQEKMAVSSVNENKKSILSYLDSNQYPYDSRSTSINDIELENSQAAIRRESDGSFSVYENGSILYTNDGDPASGYRSIQEAQADFPWAKSI